MPRPRGVLRVIGGAAGGRRIAAPAGSGTRPMRDRVRESLFSALEVRGLVASAAVLDLFAGSGSLGIEALSRGAHRLVAIERDPDAARLVADNLRTLGFADRARVVGHDVRAVVGGAPPREAPFDLVLCDPPLALDDAEVEAVLAGLDRPGWLAADATVVVQRRTRPPVWPAGWDTTWERSFGDTLIAIARVPASRRAAEAPSRREGRAE